MRNVFVVGPDKKVKLILVYPMTTGRNFDELLRVIDSLQLSAAHKVATPVNWKRGENVIIAGSVSDEDAKKIFPYGWQAPRRLRGTSARRSVLDLAVRGRPAGIDRPACGHSGGMRTTVNRGGQYVGLAGQLHQATRVRSCRCPVVRVVVHSAMMFQPRVVGILVVAGVLLQAAPLFLTLSAVLLWSVLVPAAEPI